MPRLLARGWPGLSCRVPSCLFPGGGALRAEALHRPRGIAASEFPPLRNIPHCCLPQESGPCLSSNVAVRPLRPATHRRLGGLLNRQQANGTRARPAALKALFPGGDAPAEVHGVLPPVSGGCPPPPGRLPTRYSPVRHSHTDRLKSSCNPVRLACVRHAASVRPEPGSNSRLYLNSLFKS